MTNYESAADRAVSTTERRLRGLMSDPDITVIEVNGSRPSFVQRRGESRPSKRVTIPFSEQDVISAVGAMVAPDPFDAENPKVHIDIDDWHLAATHACIGDGSTYVVVRRRSPAEARLYELMQDPDVTEIRVHGLNPIAVFAKGQPMRQDPPLADNDQDLLIATKFLLDDDDALRHANPLAHRKIKDRTILAVVDPTRLRLIRGT